MAARHVIAAAMAERHEQLRGEASPLDYDGARMVLAALELAGFTINQTDDGAPAPGPTPQPAMSPVAPSSPLPRTFELVRYRDLSGVSGTGPVAEGVEYSDGSVALRWKGDHPATAVWPSLDDVLAVHGHEGATVVRWLDAGPVDYWPAEGGPQ